MEPRFKDFTLKNKLSYILLYCLDYGCGKGDSIDKIKKSLKLQFDSDIYRIRCCIDLIQDTEEAMLSFAEYGLEKFSLNNNRNKRDLFIRLYGLLNAVYLQSQAIIELYEILNVPNKNTIICEFKKLKIYEIRNIAAAHTVDYDGKGDLSSDGRSKRYFQISQITITAKSEELNIIGEFAELRTYNLYNSFLEFNKVAEQFLYNGTMNYFNRVIRSVKSKKCVIEHYEMNGCEYYNYQKLYKNDKLYKRSIRKIHSELQIDIEKKFPT